MSTVITVVTATTMQLKMNSSNEKLVQALYEQIESDPNYPIIPPSHTNRIVNPANANLNSKEWHSSKLVKLLDCLLLLKTCVSDNYQVSYGTVLSYLKPSKNQSRNITHFKSVISF